MIIATDTDNHEEITYFQRDELTELLRSSSYEGRAKIWMNLNIIFADTIEEYEKLKANLWANQVGIDGAINPGQREINQHLRKITNKYK